MLGKIEAEDEVDPVAENEIVLKRTAPGEELQNFNWYTMRFW